MVSSKLVHLKPTLWRAFQRACARHDRLAKRFDAEGMNDHALHLRVDRARDAMLGLAGRCHAVECAIENAVVGDIALESVDGFGLVTAEQLLSLPAFDDEVIIDEGGPIIPRRADAAPASKE